MDYVSFDTTLQFAECERMSCVNITINEDETLENIESFFVTLERNGLDSSITLNPTRAEIEIRDNDDGGFIIFFPYLRLDPTQTEIKIIDNDGMHSYCSSLNHCSTLHTWPTICFNGCLPMQMP